MLIGLSGQAQHGKDTVGNFLADNYGFTTFAFADTLKSMALVLDPWVHSVEDPEPRRLHWLVDELGWEGAKQNPEVRRFLQVLGTEAVRDHLGDNTWVQVMANKLTGAGVINDDAQGFYPGKSNGVITDARFPNEADAVHAWGGKLVLVVRPNFDNGVPITHASEQHVHALDHDNVIVNDGTLDELCNKVDDLLFRYGVNTYDG